MKKLGTYIKNRSSIASDPSLIPSRVLEDGEVCSFDANLFACCIGEMGKPLSLTKLYSKAGLIVFTEDDRFPARGALPGVKSLSEP